MYRIYTMRSGQKWVCCGIDGNPMAFSTYGAARKMARLKSLLAAPGVEFLIEETDDGMDG